MNFYAFFEDLRTFPCVCVCVYSLSLSAVQRALQKASFRRNWSHHHQPAGGEDVNILIRLSVHLRRRPQVCYVYTCVCVCVCRTSGTISTRYRWSEVWWWTWKWEKPALKSPATVITRWTEPCEPLHSTETLIYSLLSPFSKNSTFYASCVFFIFYF